MNLLAYVTTVMGSRRGEDIASGALAYLLHSHDSIRHAFVEVVGERAGVTQHREMIFAVQRHGGPDGGVTDISGYGTTGLEELIIEAKIDASLRPGQIQTYLGRLTGDDPVLVVLTPAARLRAVFAEAVRQVGATAQDDLHATCGATTMVGLSWEDVARCLERAASPDATVEVAQVIGLYRYLEGSAFIPLSNTDVEMANGRLWRSIDRASTATLSLLSEPSDADVQLDSWSRNTGSSFGRWAWVNGVRAWFGVWPEQWADQANTPFWLYLQNLTDSKCARARAALADLDGAGRTSVSWQPGDRWIAVAIYPKLDEDLDAVAAGMAATVRTAAKLLLATGVCQSRPASSDDDADLSTPGSEVDGPLSL